MSSSRYLNAALWSALELLFRQIVQLGIVICLTRLLGPEEFGTIALLALYVALAGAFAEGGMAMSLIQRQDIDRTDESTAFWLNILLASCVGTILALCAPLIAALYDKPILVPLTYVSALTLVIASFGSVHAALLTKQLQFRPLMFVGVGSSLASGTVAITLAWLGYGVWALSAQAATAASAGAILLWLLSSWRPLLTFDARSVRSLAGFGGYWAVYRLFSIVYANLYTLAIGKLYGTRELGFYARADTTASLGVYLFNGIMGRITLPTLAEAAEDRQRLVRAFRLAVQTSMPLYMPAVLGLSLAAEPFVVAVYGEAWRPVFPILQALCIANLFHPLDELNKQALLALGVGSLFLRVELMKKGAGMVLVIVGSLFGPLHLAWSLVLAAAIALAIGAYYTRTLVGYGLTAQLRDSSVSIAIAAGVAMATLLADRVLSGKPAIIAFLGQAAFGFALLVALAIAFQIPAYRQLKARLKP